MPKGIFKHLPQCGFQKGHKSFLTKESKRKISETLKNKRPFRKPAEKICQICGLPFYRTKNDRDRLWNKRKFCSMKCNGISHRNYRHTEEWKNEARRKWLTNNPNKGKFGREHPCWREIKKHPLYGAIREIFKYRKWRSDIFARDNFTCVLCGIRNGDKQADHYPKMFAEIISEYKIKTLDEAIACKEFWNLDNGRTLCVSCHKKTNTYLKKIK